MLFCPKCGSLLKTKSVDKNIINFCSCGYSVKSKSKDVIVEKPSLRTDIIEASEISPLATENHVCKKCGFNKALIVASEIAVRETAGCCEADRPAYICGKCGFKEFI